MRNQNRSRGDRVTRTANDILIALRDPSIPMSHEDIRDAYAILKSRNNTNAALATHAFKIGDRVEFDTSKGRYAGKWTGQVEKINQKTIGVRARLNGKTDGPETRWTVHASMLRASL